MKSMNTQKSLSLLCILAAMLNPVSTHAKASSAWVQEDSGKTWLRLPDGSWPSGCWYEVDGKLYCFDQNGYRKSGWVQEADGTWYFLQADGSLAKNLKIAGGWCDDNGIWRKPGWNKVLGNWQYVLEDGGICINGWRRIDHNWYHFDRPGNMSTGLYTENARTYNLGADGAMRSLQWINGQFFGEDGALLPYAATEDDGNIGCTSFSFTKAQAQKLIQKGALGFYESIGSADAKEAARIVQKPKAILQGWTDLGGKGDATSLENLEKAIGKLQDYEKLRQKEGLPAQKTTLELMAIAQVQANYSRIYTHQHSKAYHVAENLVWTAKEPYSLWYYAQKANKENQSGSCDHYEAICASYTHTGLAVNDHGDLSGWDGRRQETPAWAQTFYYRQYGMSIQQLADLFASYKHALQKALR